MTKDRALWTLWYPKQQLTQYWKRWPNFNCLELVADIRVKPLQGHAIHTKAWPRTFRRVPWLIVSKAANRSIKTSAVGSPCDSERLISFLICRKAVSVEWPVLYADWWGLSRLLLLMCYIGCLTTTCCTSLDIKYSPDTGP